MLGLACTLAASDAPHAVSAEPLDKRLPQALRLKPKRPIRF